MNRNEVFEYTLKTLLQPIWQYLEDETISEVLVNGPNEIYIESQGKLSLTDAKFEDSERLEAACRNIAQFSGIDLEEKKLRLDARLPDGSRVHMIFPPLARKGICVAIRKFSREQFTLPALVEKGVLSHHAKTYLEWCVLTNRNIMIAGGTSSGKTTLLNALTEVIPSDQRIITLEDTFELQLKQPHVVALETRKEVAPGEKPITMRELFTSSLRMRPDRIIIGELRGEEAVDYLQAMISGHGGSLSTIHADTPLDALHRLQTLVTLSKLELPPLAVLAQIRSAIQVIVQMSKNYKGERVVTEISELSPESDNNVQFVIHKIFELRPKEENPLESALAWTGKKSRLSKWSGVLPESVDLGSLVEIIPE
jgi:pilus assembly protein CpaF